MSSRKKNIGVGRNSMSLYTGSDIFTAIDTNLTKGAVGVPMFNTVMPFGGDPCNPYCCAPPSSSSGSINKEEVKKIVTEQIAALTDKIEELIKKVNDFLETPTAAGGGSTEYYRYQPSGGVYY